MTRIQDFLTAEQVQLVIEIWNHRKSDSEFVDEVEDKVLAPNMNQINHCLGQENDPRYLAYMLNAALAKTVMPRSQ